jgi:hypothetical protein
LLFKGEILDLFDFNYFYVMKSLYVGDLGVEIFFYFLFGPCMYHFIFASVCTVYAGNNFDFELAPKKVVSDSFEVHLNVSNSFFLIFTFFTG